MSTNPTSGYRAEVLWCRPRSRQPMNAVGGGGRPTNLWDNNQQLVLDWCLQRQLLHDSLHDDLQMITTKAQSQTSTSKIVQLIRTAQHIQASIRSPSPNRFATGRAFGINNTLGCMAGLTLALECVAAAGLLGHWQAGGENRQTWQLANAAWYT